MSAAPAILSLAMRWPCHRRQPLFQALLSRYHLDFITSTPISHIARPSHAWLFPAISPLDEYYHIYCCTYHAAAHSFGRRGHKSYLRLGRFWALIASYIEYGRRARLFYIVKGAPPGARRAASYEGLYRWPGIGRLRRWVIDYKIRQVITRVPCLVTLLTIFEEMPRVSRYAKSCRRAPASIAALADTADGQSRLPPAYSRDYHIVISLIFRASHISAQYCPWQLWR